MQEVTVSGRFVNEQRIPAQGKIRFIPSKVWLDEGDVSYPTLAPEIDLVNGEFSVQLTRTDQHELPWHYTVDCPVGQWTIRVEDDGPLLLKNLLPKRFA